MFHPGFILFSIPSYHALRQCRLATNREMKEQTTNNNFFPYIKACTKWLMI